MKKTALVAMSGGVDSSVAALLLQEAGYACTGATMKLFTKDPARHDDAEDARQIAERLHIPFHICDFSEFFADDVIGCFINSYMDGATPNPCVDCNRQLKFGQLLQKAAELGCDYLATGHYARVEYSEAKQRFLLRKAADPAKDQSYVLFSLTQEQLRHVIFPLGAYSKPEIRKIAEAHGFANAAKHDSQDICFIPDGDYCKFIEEYTGRTFPPGNFVDEDGNVLGRHKGIIRYTVGQRKGLGLALPQPMYVKEIDPASNTVVLTTNSGLFSRTVIADNINLIDCDRITEPRRVKARIRYHQQEQWATVTQPEDDRLEIIFDEPQRAITKGQAVVMYDGEYVVGGGKII